jgi:hypothetical protein
LLACPGGAVGLWAVALGDADADADADGLAGLGAGLAADWDAAGTVPIFAVLFGVTAPLDPLAAPAGVGAPETDAPGPPPIGSNAFGGSGPPMKLSPSTTA